MKQKGVCQDCGKPTSYKTFKRCPSCARKGSLNPNWGNFTSADENKGRQRARRRFSLGPCERCEKPAFDRHHLNGNPFDNSPDNVVILCRRCHMIADSRLDALIERQKAGRKYADNAAKFRALRARRKAEGRPIRKKQ